VTVNHYLFGKLCPLTQGAGCQELARSLVKTTVTATTSVMSRGCDHCRFHKYVVIMKTTDCWLWTGTFYTQFRRPTYGQAWLHGQRMGAHRMSYLLHVGPVPDDLDILHSCDIKACVNPAHLRPGTHAENIQEAFAKLPVGHFAGERNGRARLNWSQVHEIRHRIARGERYVDLAPIFGVSPTQIGQIARNKRWIEPVAAEAVA
jgi:hypothetical protein